MAMLEVKNLEVYYGVICALKGISFEVNEGEIVSLIGANGAGKTTMMQSVVGLLPKKAGSVVFNGQDITKTPCHKIVQLGMTQVPEGRRIFQELSVYENLMMGAYTIKDQQQFKADIESTFERFPRLKERRNQIAGTLSGGEQQMLAMSRALMSHPKLLMLDEPSMGLAPILVDQIFEIIKELHAAGTTILLVEQNATKALQIADRAYVLENGLITLSGTGDELSQSDEVRKAYLGG
jgi:branched-chain amino acid transport system ATP-binding protein